MRRGLAWAATVGVSLGVLVALERDARADLGAGVTVLVAVAVTDVGLTTYDTILAAGVNRPSKTYGIVEGAFAAPQAAFGYAGAVLVAQTANDEDVLTIVSPILTIPSFMAVHGIWAAGSPHVDPGALYGASWAVGADAVLTAGTLGGLVGGRPLMRPYGVLELVATAPQIAVASYELGAGTTERGAWIALDAWAGALFVHGLVSVIAADSGSHEPPEPPPEPPPPKQPSPITPPITPDEPTPPGPLAPGPAQGRARWEVGPLALRGGGGLVVHGAW